MLSEFYIKIFGDWGLGIGPIPNPQSPIPNPHSLNIVIENVDIIIIE